MTVRDDVDQGGPAFAAEQQFDPRIYLGILRRRYPFLLVPAVLISGVVYWIAQTLPPVYQARATILVESQQIPTDLARPTVSANAAERIQLIQQRLIARDNLLDIARKYALYANRHLSPSEIVDQIRRSTSIDQIDVGNRAQPNTQAIGFTVSFSYSDGDTAAKVANEHVTSILQQNIQSRTNRASETAKFFETQVASLERDLAAQEARIVEFKNKNQDSLPETLGSRQSQLLQLQGQMAESNGRSAVLETQRQVLAQGGDGPLDPAAANSTEAQLTQLRMQLVQLRAVYSDTHPDVKAVVAKIAAMEKASAAQPPAPAKKDEASKASAASDARLANIDQQLQQLKEQRADLEKRAAALDVSIQKTPQVDIALKVLMRDYETLQTQYGSAKAKLAAAATGEQLEQDRQAERFEVVEQATVPNEPISPNRKRIAFQGAFAGIGAGVGLVMLVEFLDKSIRGAADLQRRLQIRPISSIPYIVTSAEKRRRRRILGYVAAGIGGAIILALVFLQLFYLPLDLVAQKILLRLGM